MKVTIFTSNQTRHAYLINSIAAVADETYVVQECNTIFPGQVEDFFKKSQVMQEYFYMVQNAQSKIFGISNLLDKNIRVLSMKLHDLKFIKNEQLAPVLKSDLYIVFGASYIKGWLIDFLVNKQAINIHMGISPYYRGSSCNFWALKDNNLGHVGATIHYLSKGLDSGNMLYHCLPKLVKENNLFDFSMRAVKVAHDSLVKKISNNEIKKISPVKQDKSLEISYTRNSDFTDNVAKNFLKRNKEDFNYDIIYPKLLNPIFE